MKIEFTEELSFEVLTEYAEKKLKDMSKDEQLKLMCEHAYALEALFGLLIDTMAKVLDFSGTQKVELLNTYGNMMETFNYDAIPEDGLNEQLHFAVRMRFPMDEDEHCIECIKKAVEEA